MDLIKIHELPEGATIEDGHEVPVSTGSNSGDVKRFSMAILKAWIIGFVTPLFAGITQGPAGPSGAPGSQGIQGQKGDKGDQGDRGDQGLKGDIGPAGAIGIQGAKGDKGDKGDQGAQGTQGIKGDKGDQGDQGFPGLNGDNGQGVPLAGTTKQMLVKGSDADFDTQWADNGFTDIVGQPDDNSALAAALSLKVDKSAGYGLSQNNYTTAEKDKLANLSEHFKGNYTTFAALVAANPTGSLGDYAFVDQGTGHDAKMYIWDGDDNTWVISSATVIPDATEVSSGLVELATIAEALARTDDQRAMTALKTIALILDEKKNADRQIAPVGVNEVSFLMKSAGNVLSSLISGASNLKLKVGISGTYPVGAQTYPLAYAAGDRVFATYNYTDLANASCNIILTCRDN